VDKNPHRSETKPTLLLGCIADDFTGATDLANNLTQAGMRVVQTIGIPAGPIPGNVDAIVVALKSRTIPASEAVAASLLALSWLRTGKPRQIYFKYCSTFDSTPKGNIGPVTDALMDALDCRFTVSTPAFPGANRTVYQGYLFVEGELLNESGMRHHPLTPMTDANLVRVLQKQTQKRVGLIPHSIVSKGAESVAAKIKKLREGNVGIAIIDAIANDDLFEASSALIDLPLVTAGSGLASGLAYSLGFRPSRSAATLPPPQGKSAVIAGSCSAATNKQVARFQKTGLPTWEVNPTDLAYGVDVVQQALEFAVPQLEKGTVLIYSTVNVDDLKQIQQELGSEEAGTMIEKALASIARGLVNAGVGQLIVAGGETSGACVQALDIRQLQIGPQIDPGVPWCYVTQGTSIHLALKSGNFGADDFFTSAFEKLGK